MSGVRLELREQFGDRPPATVATARLLEDGTVEVAGEPTNAEFLSRFRVCVPGTDRWVSKDDDPLLWLELMPGAIGTPFRWIELHDARPS